MRGTGNREKPKPKPDDPAQSQRFVETAKALEVDESGEAFAKVVNSIVKPSKLNRAIYRSRSVMSSSINSSVLFIYNYCIIGAVAHKGYRIHGSDGTIHHRGIKRHWGSVG